MKRVTGIDGIFFKARDPAALRLGGCKVLARTADTEFGKFGRVIDPEGSKAALWQPSVGQ